MAIKIRNSPCNFKITYVRRDLWTLTALICRFLTLIKLYCATGDQHINQV